MCVFCIERSDVQIRKFASWTNEMGLVGFTKVLDEKTRNFHGKVMKIGFYDVRLTVYSYK